MYLKGLYTALITPFTPTGQLDEEGLKKLIQIQLHHQVDGVVVLGTTGESPTLTQIEKRRIIEIALEEIQGRIKVIVGTGSYSTQQAIEQTRQAKQMGADAALIVTPYYNKPTQEGIFKHFEAINQAVSFPICLYNIQGRTGQNIQTHTLKRISTLSSIIGVKETSGDINQIMDVIEAFHQSHPNFAILSGDDALTLPIIALGGHGIISVVSNLVPAAMKSLVNAALNGNFKKARIIHNQLYSFIKAVFIETNPIPIKAALSLSKLPAGSCRLPLCDLSQNYSQKLAQILNELPQEWISHG
ncbi:4-hydroxy-tetrahydrodipicolinate synthase [Candidatus Protochlamydia amoebophila]|uniref:4-hydroxy-tetrahydrodipicolinate synthase n=1 Tax=Candidatus Protochlamydia amoebophila TaxID=362787 RepID=UPI001BCA4FAC|nr:4-hydroxy-tetrahydrodipicolinate synthase [Candidatus Protochlamydia amoebophila]